MQTQPELKEQRDAWLEDLQRLFYSNRVERFAYAHTLTKDKEKESVRSALQVWLSFARDVLMQAGGASDAVTNIDCLETITNLAASLQLQAAQQMVANLEHTLSLMDYNINTRLAIEVLLLDLPRTQSL
jgi:DNA polymerase-3 subunit delta'